MLLSLIQSQRAGGGHLSEVHGFRADAEDGGQCEMAAGMVRNQRRRFVVTSLAKGYCWTRELYRASGEMGEPDQAVAVGPVRGSPFGGNDAVGPMAAALDGRPLR